MKAVQKFKRLIEPAKETPMHSILGQEHEFHFVQPPLEMEPEESLSPPTKSHNPDTHNSEDKGRDLAVKGDHPEGGVSPERKNSASVSSQQDSDERSSRHPSKTASQVKDSAGSSMSGGSVRADSADDARNISASKSPSPPPQLSRADTPTTKHSTEGTRGHARDPLEEEHLYLFIGPSTFTGDLTEDSGSLNHDGLFKEPDTSMTGILEFPNTLPPIDTSAVPVVSESPGAAEIDIYETAYREEIERIRKRSMARQGTEPKLYLTRRVEGKNVDLGDARVIGKEEPQPQSQPKSDSTVQIGEKRAVPPAGAAASAMTAMFDAQKQQQQTPESTSTTTDQ